MKKTALGLTLALTMSTVLACAPGNQGTMDNTNRDGTAAGNATRGYYEDGTYTGVRGLGTNNDGLFGRNWGANYNAPGTPNRDGIYGRGADTNIGMTGRDNLNNAGRGGGLLYGGYGPRTQNIGGGWNQNGMGGNFGAGLNGGRGFGQNQNGMFNQIGSFDEELSRSLQQRIANLPEVENCNVVATDNEVFIGVDTNDDQGQTTAQNRGNNNSLIQKIRNEVQDEARGKQIIISTDQGQRQAGTNNHR